MKDPLLSLLRLRSVALDDARRVVKEALDEHHDTQRRLRAAEGRLESETRAATALHVDDAAVESFACWLPIGHAEVLRCRNEERKAGDAVDRARAALGLAHMAVEVVEKLLARRAEADAAALARREQTQLDEFSVRRPPRG